MFVLWLCFLKFFGRIGMVRFFVEVFIKERGVFDKDVIEVI